MIEPITISPICPMCDQPMLGTSCTDTRGWAWGRIEIGEPLDALCRDCGASPGGYHHDGCLVARCRTCGDQIPACWCDPPTAA